MDSLTQINTKQLPALPFSKNALEPFLSSETLEYHYEKHHRSYVEKLNHLIQNTEYQTLTLKEIVLKSDGPIFNNAAQAWNHGFYWNSLTPSHRSPSAAFKKVIENQFGSFEVFLKKFHTTASELFGSGWVWLVQNYPKGDLSIINTQNAENPLRLGKKPILTWDLWEHAYYIDYRNDRERYLKAVPEILNWEFAESNYSMSFEAEVNQPLGKAV